MGWEAFMDNRASSRFTLVRGRKDSSGLHEFGFGHRISLLFVALVLMFLIPHSASAQATATLNGVVRDSSGAVIPQATVTLHNTDTGTNRESLTNDSGLYVFVSVPPGEYALKVTKNGFTTTTQAGLHVLVDQASTFAWNIAEYVILFALVLLHEFGHALACRQVGGTANQIVLWPLGGVAYVEPPPRPGGNPLEHRCSAVGECSVGLDFLWLRNMGEPRGLEARNTECLLSAMGSFLDECWAPDFQSVAHLPSRRRPDSSLAPVVSCGTWP
jgi:hypothetical protein